MILPFAVQKLMVSSFYLFFIVTSFRGMIVKRSKWYQISVSVNKTILSIFLLEIVISNLWFALLVRLRQLSENPEGN